MPWIRVDLRGGIPYGGGMPLVRLSVIVPATAGENFAERAIRSVFNQADPIGIEVIALIPEGSAKVRAHLEAVFQRPFAIGTLRFSAWPAKLGIRQALNAGAKLAAGNFLAFLETHDQWRYGRLIELWPVLESFDLILSPQIEYAQAPDWLREYLARRQGNLSAAVVRKSLFESAGGFPGGPTLGGFGLWLKCLSLLERSGRKKRFLALPGHNIKSDLGFDPSSRSGLRDEALTILRVWPTLPRGYRIAALRSSFSRFLSFT